MAALSGIPRQEGCEEGEETAHPLSSHPPGLLQWYPCLSLGKSDCPGARMLKSWELEQGTERQKMDAWWQVKNKYPRFPAQHPSFDPATENQVFFKLGGLSYFEGM